MQYDIITIFPKILDAYFNESILKRAQQARLINIKTHDLRDYTADKHRSVDDAPYGGGPGMVLMVEPIYKCLKKIKRQKKSRVILLDPAGKQFDQKMAEKFSKLDQLVFICGRYEGIDARVDNLIDEKISVGPYVLSGGELPAAIIIEATARLLPGVLGKIESTEYETFAGEKSDVVEYPQYTRPENFKGMKVPEILLSGNHKEIEKWRQSKQK
ncbi:TPA: tRNA (guanosine(37)-N1)-methyltransferase TrmD [Candidatus Komeilibacteria bacterium]|nr:MAG: tRNA (guanine-N(1)-)-methyltransferase [Parcubacteria group bacterium GW2011_GWF2_45_11]OGY94783.1 MAG: tRNA (guanosine(37)-N1)-methyltransferase TrmD [Candidatus Komeilibacteria bacterium RIFOXYC2_FULL_45_12]HAH04390.1 tRNA (guanosine(37)-N1)-methyltransferase TrmD [Candidatus Komeilibacteria bacterium]HCC73270.1 tRNA (guanosine(37)-N1)-methyltransferase TrmD [Candidatus Komeilibacteria bacterium]